MTSTTDLINSKTHRVWIKFRTDVSAHGRGFHAVYDSGQSVECLSVESFNRYNSTSLLRPVHTRQQSCRKRQQIVAETIVAENGNIVARNGNNLLPFSPKTATNCFSATLLPGVDMPLRTGTAGYKSGNERKYLVSKNEN